jgi:hypothetical protein
MEDMHIEGRVVNRAVTGPDEFRLGIQFTKISDLDRGLVADFVKITSKK